MEHVFSQVIGESHLELESSARSQSPRFFHRFVGITGTAIAAQALLVDVVNVDHVSAARWVCEDPLFSGA